MTPSLDPGIEVHEKEQKSSEDQKRYYHGAQADGVNYPIAQNVAECLFEKIW
jgi:hypothetical protein